MTFFIWSNCPVARHSMSLSIMARLSILNTDVIACHIILALSYNINILLWRSVLPLFCIYLESLLALSSSLPLIFRDSELWQRLTFLISAKFLTIWSFFPHWGHCILPTEWLIGPTAVTAPEHRLDASSRIRCKIWCRFLLLTVF